MSSDSIAWLVPTANNPLSHRFLSIPANAPLLETLPHRVHSTLPSLLDTTAASQALQLSFTSSTKRPGKFILGTDPQSCDIVLPSLPNISRQHAFLSFDGQARLTITDLSEHGTSVWYDWESRGDKKDYTWILSSLGEEFPNSAKRILIDIQGVRFQIIVNKDYAAACQAAYQEKVDKFSELSSWTDGLSWGWDRALPPVAPLSTQELMFQHIYVKKLGDEVVGEMYLWNVNRPWEALVKATA